MRRRDRLYTWLSARPLVPDALIAGALSRGRRCEHPDLVFVVPWAQLAPCVFVAAVLGLLASVVTARRAARVSPIVALASE